ncbi:hypothetical protein ACF09Z_04695 [Streptomyces erythrochromogenes]|uniref:hypothetical protein n=1 Tax=Streptomyces erythrochromogenes TaxID=285574 RepID=UPI0037031DB8
MPYARRLVTTTTGSPVFTGVWAERHWLNVPGPFYGAKADTMEFGRAAAPRHVAWTAGSVRDWWRDRERVREWALTAAAEREAEEDERYRAHHRDAAQGHRDFVAPIDDGLEAYLRGYLFRLDQRREPRPDEPLPRL